MSPRTKIVSKLISRWRDRLFLNTWDIRWCWAEFSGDTNAQTSVVSGRKCATIEIYTNINSWEDLHHVVIHELLHCVFGRTVLSVATLQSSGSIGAPVWAAWHEQFREIHEVDVDHMTVCLKQMFSDNDLKKLWNKSKRVELYQ